MTLYPNLSFFRYAHARICSLRLLNVSRRMYFKNSRGKYANHALLEFLVDICLMVKNLRHQIPIINRANPKYSAHKLSYIQRTSDDNLLDHLQFMCACECHQIILCYAYHTIVYHPNHKELEWYKFWSNACVYYDAVCVACDGFWWVRTFHPRVIQPHHHHQHDTHTTNASRTTRTQTHTWPTRAY